MAGKNGALVSRKDMDSDSCDSEEEREKMEEYLKQRKLMKKKMKEHGIVNHGMSGKGVRELEWECHSDVQGTKWGVDFGCDKGMFRAVGIRGGVGYEAYSEKKSFKCKVKYSS